MLVDHGDAQVEGSLGRVDMHGLAVYQHMTLFRQIKPGEDVHQRGFAGAVFPQQGMNFTLIDRQIDAVVCQDAGKPFCNLPHFHGERSRDGHGISRVHLYTDAKMECRPRMATTAVTPISNDPVSTSYVPTSLLRDLACNSYYEPIIA